MTNSEDARKQVEAVRAEARSAAAANARLRADYEDHIKRVNRAAVEAMILAISDASVGRVDEPEAIAWAIIVRIAKRKIPAVTITY